MDETIDLRPYVDALVRRWRVIPGAVIAGILIATLLHFSSLNYRATALVAAVDPAVRMQFDSRITPTLDLDGFKAAYSELASSDSVLSVVLARANELSGGDIATLPDLRDLLEVNTGTDLWLLRLSVRYKDSQTAAELANVWANAFIKTVDEMYLGQSGQVTFYGGLRVDTIAELQGIEQALVDFQSGNRMVIIENQLFSLGQQQATYLADQRRLGLLLEDIETLSAQIEAGSGDKITFADQLTALTLQQNAYIHETPVISPTVGIAQSSSASVQLQANPEFDLTTGTRSEQLALLGALSQTVEARLATIDVKLLELESSFFSLQREQQSIANRYDELIRQRDVAAETAVTLARKIDEVRIQSQDSGSSLRIASVAAVPEEYDRSSLVVTAAVAAVAGLLISIASIILVTWRRSSSHATQRSNLLSDPNSTYGDSSGEV